MRTYRRIFLFAVLLLLCTTMVLPVSAAKPTIDQCGLLTVQVSDADERYYMAVCISEEDGNFVYSGSHPIQQQSGMYVTVTNDLYRNNIYALEEDSEYVGVSGVYRFALAEKIQPGSQADVFPEMAEVRKNETVYFVHYDPNVAELFPMEKTTVTSIRNGRMTTADALEDEYENGDFSVIFNSNGDVVGFCKSGVATALISKNSGLSSHVIVILGGVMIAAICVGVIIFTTRKKKKMPEPDGSNDMTMLDDENTTLDSGTRMDFDDIRAVPGNSLVLVCRGGYLNGRIYPIPAEGITIGREPDNSIRYPSQTPGISRHHVRLFWQNGQLVLMDVGSSNGTYLNHSGRIPSMRPFPLKNGDIFYLGEKLNGFEISYE